MHGTTTEAEAPPLSQVEDRETWFCRMDLADLARYWCVKSRSIDLLREQLIEAIEDRRLVGRIMAGRMFRAGIGPEGIVIDRRRYRVVDGYLAVASIQTARGRRRVRKGARHG